MPGSPSPDINRQPEFDPTPVVRIYDSIAPSYASRFGEDLQPGSTDRALVVAALTSAPARGPVLDLGCGPGQIVAIAQAAGIPAVGADASLNMLAQARRFSPRGGFVGADARALPLASESCRAVAAFYVLHHLPRTELGTVLAEARRVLPSRGTLIIATHLGVGERWVTSEWEGVQHHSLVTFYSNDELAAHVQAAGFKIESVDSRPARPDEFQAEHGFVLARAAQ